MEKPVIFMVEDEISVLSANKRMLSRRGYEVVSASDVHEAEEYLNDNTPDLMILDIMLPDGSGYDICEMFRKRSENPVIFLTGKDSVNDKVDGLSMGGDYYLTKPYDFEVLLAVVNRLLERSVKINVKEEQLTQIKKGSLTLDMQRNCACIGERVVSLTGKELGLLRVFMENEGKELSCEDLYEKVWNTKAIRDVRTVRKHIMNLRTKIRAGETDEYDIVTSYGKGYIFK